LRLQRYTKYINLQILNESFYKFLFFFVESALESNHSIAESMIVSLPF
jgi:hypothetical protein